MKGKKPKAFALLLDDADRVGKGKPPDKRPPDEPDGDEPEYDAEDDFASDDAGDDGMGDDEDMSEPDGDEASGSAIDPEQRQLAETLGFTEPDQQRALIDLIKSVAGSTSSPPSSSTSSAGGSLPPEGY